MKFIQATSAEIPLIANLADIIWREYYTDIIGKEQVEYMLSHIQNEQAMLSQLEKGMNYFTLYDGEIPCGYLGYNIESNGRFFLSKLYILKEYRGNGSLTLALEHFKALDAKSVYLTVNRFNTHSIAAYEKKGFKKIRTEVADIGGGYVMDDYIMELIF